jgi:hypothetical protein
VTSPYCCWPFLCHFGDIDIVRYGSAGSGRLSWKHCFFRRNSQQPELIWSGCVEIAHETHRIDIEFTIYLIVLSATSRTIIGYLRSSLKMQISHSKLEGLLPNLDRLHGALTLGAISALQNRANVNTTDVMTAVRGLQEVISSQGLEIAKGLRAAFQARADTRLDALHLEVPRLT